MPVRQSQAHLQILASFTRLYIYEPMWMILMITCHSKWYLLLILMNYIGNTKHQQKNGESNTHTHALSLSLSLSLSHTHTHLFLLRWVVEDRRDLNFSTVSVQTAVFYVAPVHNWQWKKVVSEDGCLGHFYSIALAAGVLSSWWVYGACPEVIWFCSSFWGEPYLWFMFQWY